MNRNADRYAHWEGIMVDQEASGLSGAAYCREHGLKIWQFYAWRRRLRNRRAAEKGFVPLCFNEDRSEVGSGVRLVVGTVRIEVGVGFDESVLSGVLRVLGAGGC